MSWGGGQSSILVAFVRGGCPCRQNRVAKNFQRRHSKNAFFKIDGRMNVIVQRSQVASSAPWQNFRKRTGFYINYHLPRRKSRLCLNLLCLRYNLNRKCIAHAHCVIGLCLNCRVVIFSLVIHLYHSSLRPRCSYMLFHMTLKVLF